MAATTFKGFPAETLKFLSGLQKNNTKTWFDAHRSDYDEYFVAPAKQFASAVESKLQKISEAIVVEPRINGSIFRINRDIRFSKDKRPYKDHMDFAFWEGEKKSRPSKFFLRLTPDQLIVGAGFHSGCPEHLKGFRDAADADESGSELAAIAKKLRKKGYEMGGSHYKRIPRGYSGEGPAGEFLLYDGLYVIQEDSASAACSAKMLTECLKVWRSLNPLHRWLNDNI